jgi:hypothetical protein
MKAASCNPEQQHLLAAHQHLHSQPQSKRRLSRFLIAGVASVALLFVYFSHRATNTFPYPHKPHRHQPDISSVQQCSIDNLKADLSFLDNAKPIEAEEFLERRDRLAKALHENGVDAFVLEPGYTFQYVKFFASSSAVRWGLRLKMGIDD